MRIVISEFISLDGVVQAPGGPEQDTDGGFRHGGRSVRFFDPQVMGKAIDEMSARTDALLQGRRTWQIMAGAWPDRAGDPFADWMNRVQKYVVSDGLSDADVTWKPTTIIRGGELVKKVSGLREQRGGDVNVMGSASLVRALLAADLVDELDLMIEPIVLGGGKGIFLRVPLARASPASAGGSARLREGSRVTRHFSVEPSALTSLGLVPSTPRGWPRDLIAA